MLLHVVVHLLLFVSCVFVVFEFVILVFVEISLALFIDLVFNIFVFKHKILFVTIMFVELSLFFWGQLLSKMMSPGLSQ